VGSVYLITNLLNGKKYVGQTTANPRKRWNNHCRGFSLVAYAIRKYGKDNFKFEILLQGVEDQATLNLIEARLIRFYRTGTPNGYNVSPGGDGGGNGLCGDNHWTRRLPFRVARGDRSGPRLHPERYKHLRPPVRSGEKNNKAKLSVEKVRLIRCLYGKTTNGVYWSQRALARKFGVDQPAVGNVLRRLTWKHV
jgi:GIY-YIG catalytic domain